MESNAIVLIAGVLFLAIAIVGGGFTLERIQVPTVPNWSRIASGVLGSVFVATFFYVTLRDADPDAPRDSGDATGVETSASDPDEPDAGGPVVYELNASVPAGGDVPLALTKFKVVDAAAPTRVDDTISVEYTLENTGDRPFMVSEQFVAARSPGDDHEDFANTNNDVEVPPGETIETTGTLQVDQAGIWKVWPCFTLPDGACPDEWKVVSITVVE